MKDEDKTKEQLVNELVELRQRITQLEKSETSRKWAEEALRESEETARALLNAPIDSVILINPEGTILAINEIAAQGLGKRVDELVGVCVYNYPPPPREARVGEVIRSGKAVRFEDKREGRIFVTHIYPVFEAQGKVGRLAIFSRDITEQKRLEAKLRHSLEKWRKITNGIIHAIKKSKSRDSYILNHGWRVAKLACAIAEEAGLLEEQIEMIYVAGILHNIGKMHITAEIINKAGALSRSEVCIVKTYPQISYEILKMIEFPWPIDQIVLQHQERMDGSGYPFKLSGEDILLEARILGVANVVEAMTFNRPDRPALGIDEALKIISKKGRGLIYDPEVVHICSKLFTEKGFKFE